jgi:hypothetical protein
LELAEIITEPGDGVVLGRKLEGSEDGFMGWAGAPPAGLGTTVKQDFLRHYRTLKAPASTRDSRLADRHRQFGVSGINSVFLPFFERSRRLTAFEAMCYKSCFLLQRSKQPKQKQS